MNKPIDAKTFDQICELPRDGFHTRTHWMQLDEKVITIVAVRGTESART